MLPGRPSAGQRFGLLPSSSRLVKDGEKIRTLSPGSTLGNEKLFEPRSQHDESQHGLTVRVQTVISSLCHRSDTQFSVRCLVSESVSFPYKPPEHWSQCWSLLSCSSSSNAAQTKLWLWREKPSNHHLKIQKRRRWMLKANAGCINGAGYSETEALFTQRDHRNKDPE